MWKIGHIEINSKVVLAPMAGITFSSYRKFYTPFGVGVSVTEMVSDMGLIYGNEETYSYIDYEKEVIPTGVQLFGHDPECIKKAALIALERNPNIDFFDINMGCPVNKVTKTGAGSALMKDPKLCGEIVRVLKETTHLPVTAKIRLGYDAINFIEVIDELEKAGVDMIAIHARTKKELYSGYPHYELLKDLRNKMKVPLVVSGNIFNLNDAINALEITKADAVMVARGGIGNPTLIKQIDTYYKTGEIIPDASLLEQVKYCYDLALKMIEEKGEHSAMRIYRGIAPKFFSGFPNMKTFKGRISTQLCDLQSLKDILNNILKENNIDFSL